METQECDNGDDMGEIYPPDYQDFLDKQEPNNDDKEAMAQAMQDSNPVF